MNINENVIEEENDIMKEDLIQFNKNTYSEKWKRNN